MPVTPTTGQLESAQKIAIEEARYTEEHNAAAVALIEQMTLLQGHKSITVPKVGQFEFEDVIPGVDLEDEQEIGMTITELTAGRIGALIILLDDLVLQMAESPFKMVGRQFGDAAARKQDRDVIALFTGLNGGTEFGADNKNFSTVNAAACVAKAKANKFGNQLFVLHHPNAIYAAGASGAIVAGSTYPFPHGWSEERLKMFYKFSINQVPFFEDGNIDKVTGVDSGEGVIADKSAMVNVHSKGFEVARTRDESLFATELVASKRYGVFELDDTRGAPLLYEIGDPATNA